ncbi:MAG: hypothetical protein ACRDPC_06040 [Solirubrobacteraceae bacterium]
MNIEQAVTAAATADGSAVRRAYRRAVAHGVHNTRCTEKQESAYGTLRLLTLAMLRLPDLVLYAHLLHVYGDENDEGRLPRPVVRGVSDVAAGALRLGHRALETHARTVHYSTAAWIDRLVRDASRELDDVAFDDEATVPIVIEQARRATMALTRATAATASDPMLVPDHVATGQGHLLAVYLIATEAAGT